MNIINPLGQSVASSEEITKNPRGCMCSSGFQTTRDNAGSCFVCGCNCASGSTNRDANSDAANAKGAY